MTKISMTFNTSVAKDVGTDSAIILANIEFWQLKNQANKKHFYDGSYWTYNSVKAFAELFDYLSEKQIQNCLKKLVKKGYLKEGNYNKVAYDRTKWYSSLICPNGKMELTKWENGIDQMVEPIPYINTDIKPYIISNVRCDINEVYDWFWNTYNKKIDSKNCKSKFLKLPYEDIEKIILVLEDYIASTPEVRFRKNPLTWINGKCWNDDIQKPNENNIIDWDVFVDTFNKIGSKNETKVTLDIKKRFEAILLKGYNKSDIMKAMRNMFSSEWHKNTGNQTIEFLSRMDSFSKLANMEEIKVELPEGWMNKKLTEEQLKLLTPEQRERKRMHDVRLAMGA